MIRPQEEKEEAKRSGKFTVYILGTSLCVNCIHTLLFPYKRKKRKPHFTVFPLPGRGN